MCACCVYFGCACAHICRVVSAAAQTRKLNDAAECNAQQCEDGGRAGPFEYFRHIWLDCTHNCSVARARAPNECKGHWHSCRPCKTPWARRNGRNKYNVNTSQPPKCVQFEYRFFSYITNKQTRSSKAQLDKHTSQLTTTGFAMPRRKKLRKSHRHRCVFVYATTRKRCQRCPDSYNDTRSLPAGGGGGFRHDDDDDDDGGDASSSCHTIPLCHC